jgi:hypothetical protein
MSGHSLEREAREALAERRRPMAEPDRGLRLGREELVDFVAGLFVLLLSFIAIFYALPIIFEGVR